jgi:hypothetical protein
MRVEQALLEVRSHGHRISADGQPDPDRGARRAPEPTGSEQAR